MGVFCAPRDARASRDRAAVASRGVRADAVTRARRTHIRADATTRTAHAQRAHRVAVDAKKRRRFVG